MKTVGITAEYNPFHRGHAYQIAQARLVSGAEKVIAVMSGSFVQRGEPACADKFTRAKWALDGGADMVIELPEVFSLSCAERFASGAVRILAGTGLVDSICFGSETGDTEAIRGLARAEKDPEKLSSALSAGLSYPAALADSMGSALSPNDILGVEYVRAVDRYAPQMEVFSVKRSGGGYSDEELCEGFSSASAIRRALDPKYGEPDARTLALLKGALPEGVLDDLIAARADGKIVPSADTLSAPVLCRFRTMTSEEAAMLPEASEGLENLFVEGALKASDLYGLLSYVKSKRYTMARLKRIAMNALLGIDAELQKNASEDDRYLYISVLGVRQDSSGLLAELKANARLPVIIQASDRNGLCDEARRVARISAAAHAIRALGCSSDRSVVPDHSHKLIVR